MRPGLRFDEGPVLNRACDARVREPDDQRDADSEQPDRPGDVRDRRQRPGELPPRRFEAPDELERAEEKQRADCYPTMSSQSGAALESMSATPARIEQMPVNR
jgi:hypothetical protein